jgi:Tfp pilus assembly protein PilN
VQFNAINLAMVDHLNRRIALAVVAGISVLLAAITLFNLALGVRYVRQRVEYQEKIEALRSAAPQDQGPKIDDKTADVLADRIRFTNRLIVQDRFPWIRILNVIEEALPPEVILTEINPAGEYAVLALAGSANNVNELVRFQKALEASGLFDGVNLSTLSLDKPNPQDAHSAGIRFNISGRFRMGALFAGTDGGAIEAALAGGSGG